MVMHKLLKQFLTSGSHYVESYLVNDAATITDNRSLDYYQKQKQQALINWLNFELKGTHFEFSYYTSASVYLSYKNLDTEITWRDLSDKALELIRAVKSHDSEVMNKFIEDMEL